MLKIPEILNQSKQIKRGIKNLTLVNISFLSFMEHWNKVQIFY